MMHSKSPWNGKWLLAHCNVMLIHCSLWLWHHFKSRVWDPVALQEQNRDCLSFSFSERSDKRCQTDLVRDVHISIKSQDSHWLGSSHKVMCMTTHESLALLNIHSLASFSASAEESECGCGLTLERLAPGLILFLLWHDAPLRLKPLIPIGKTDQMRTTHTHFAALLSFNQYTAFSHGQRS